MSILNSAVTGKNIKVIERAVQSMGEPGPALTRIFKEMKMSCKDLPESAPSPEDGLSIPLEHGRCEYSVSSYLISRGQVSSIVPR